MTSYVFPGQGSQILGMSKDFYDNFNIAKETFEEIQDYAKIDLKNIMFGDNIEFLNLTKNTQLSIFTASYIIYRTLDNLKKINYSNIQTMLGHSLGEYTALTCSNKLKLEDCVMILKKRGQLMNDAIEPNTTGMAALIGLSSENVGKIIDQNDLKIEIANDNSPVQVVVSGNIDQIEKSKEIFMKNNLKKFIKLNVSAAFHSNLMLEAQKELNKLLDSIALNTNEVKIISNFNAQVSNDIAEIKYSLKNQMSNKVRWTESIRNLEKIGENKIIEIGPGNVLSGLIKRISSSFDIISINKIQDLDNIL